MKPDFSIILPVYNQAEHLPLIVNEYTSSLNASGFNYEVLLIVNGSNDASFEIATQLTRNLPPYSTYNLEEGGWGRAVKFGIEKAQGDYICYTNSARTVPADLVLILKYAKVNEESVIKANRISRESFLRKLGSVLYNFENRFFFRFPIWDVNGTPKVFPSKIIKNIDIISNGDIIDAELMAYCARKNIAVIEIPVRMPSRISGKSTTGLLSALKMYFGLMKLRRRV